MDGVDIGESVESAFDEVFSALPEVLLALGILLVGYLVAKSIMKATSMALRKVRLNEQLSSSPTGVYMSKAVGNPSHFVGRIMFWIVMLGVISLSVSVLGIEAVNDFVGAIYSYLPNVFAAIAIFLVAAAVSGASVKFVDRVMSDTPTGKVVQAVVPSVVMSIAVFMILNQLHIATAIVTITYGAIMGALALGLALAFGLGGRDVAARIMENAYTEGQKNYQQAKADVELAKQRTKSEVKKAKNKA